MSRCRRNGIRRKGGPLKGFFDSETVEAETGRQTAGLHDSLMIMMMMMFSAALK
jgi:hypothetical protein